MKRNLFVAAAAAVVLSLGAGAANAVQTVFSAQYSGVVTSGYDTAGLFGAPNTSLTGMTYTELFTIDTTKGRNDQETTFESQDGGSVLRSPSAVTASITINGHTQTLAGTYLSSAFTGFDSFANQYEIFDTAETQHITNSQVITSFISGGIKSATGAGIPTTFASYNIAVNGTTYQNYNSAFQFESDGPNGSILNSSGILGPLTATPEPMTWSLMVVGIGGMGLALRTRRRSKYKMSASAAA